MKCLAPGGAGRDFMAGFAAIAVFLALTLSLGPRIVAAAEQPAQPGAWSLIVILAAHGSPSPRGGTSIAVVQGFSERAACVLAGEQVQKSSAKHVEFACVAVK